MVGSWKPPQKTRVDVRRSAAAPRSGTELAASQPVEDKLVLHQGRCQLLPSVSFSIKKSVALTPGPSWWCPGFTVPHLKIYLCYWIVTSIWALAISEVLFAVSMCTQSQTISANNSLLSCHPVSLFMPFCFHSETFLSKDCQPAGVGIASLERRIHWQVCVASMVTVVALITTSKSQTPKSSTISFIIESFRLDRTLLRSSRSIPKSFLIISCLVP